MVVSLDEIIEVQTEYGPIHFRGHDTGRPILLFITGAFAQVDQLHRVPERFPEMDVLRAHLPGNHCPPLVGVSIDLYASAFSAALDDRFKGRDVIVVGLSVGAVVALGLRASRVREIIALEPILVTDEAWPLKVLLNQAQPGQEAFLWNVLGIGPEGPVRRDYRYVLEGLQVPVCAMLGEEPPPERPWSGAMPGMVGTLARAALAAHPRVWTRHVRGVGHNIVRDAGEAVLKTIHPAIVRTFGVDVAKMDLS